MAVFGALGAKAAFAQQGTDEPMTFFITSVGLGNGADLEGLAGADVHCQALAASAGRGDATWRAYLSTQGSDAVHARDRIGTGPWHGAAGHMIARDLAHLHGDTLEQARLGNGLHPFHALNERGDPISGMMEWAADTGANDHDIPDWLDDRRPCVHRWRRPHVLELDEQRGQRGQCPGGSPRPHRIRQHLLELVARQQRVQPGESGEQRRCRPVLLLRDRLTGDRTCCRSRRRCRRITALLHESSRARPMPTNRILTCQCNTALVGRGRSPD